MAGPIVNQPSQKQNSIRTSSPPSPHLRKNENNRPRTPQRCKSKLTMKTFFRFVDARAVPIPEKPQQSPRMQIVGLNFDGLPDPVWVCDRTFTTATNTKPLTKGQILQDKEVADPVVKLESLPICNKVFSGRRTNGKGRVPRPIFEVKLTFSNNRTAHSASRRRKAMAELKFEKPKPLPEMVAEEADELVESKSSTIFPVVRAARSKQTAAISAEAIERFAESIRMPAQRYEAMSNGAVYLMATGYAASHLFLLRHWVPVSGFPATRPIEVMNWGQPNNQMALPLWRGPFQVAQIHDADAPMVPSSPQTDMEFMLNVLGGGGAQGEAEAVAAWKKQQLTDEKPAILNPWIVEKRLHLWPEGPVSYPLREEPQLRLLDHIKMKTSHFEPWWCMMPEILPEVDEEVVDGAAYHFPPPRMATPPQPVYDLDMLGQDLGCEIVAPSKENQIHEFETVNKSTDN